MALGLVSTACTGFFGTLVCLDAHLPRPEWTGEVLGLPTGQGNLPSLKTGGGGRRVSEGVGGDWEKGGESEIF